MPRSATVPTELHVGNHTFDGGSCGREAQGSHSDMKGVYVIHDPETGKPYVGSACGDIGIWARLCQYVDPLHGGNRARESAYQRFADTTQQATARERSRHEGYGLEL